MEDVRMMDGQNNHDHDDASERIAQLEATNATLRQALSSRDEHITMLEERLLTMSVELASSRAREDEKELMLRQSELSQITMMSEDDGGNVTPQDNLLPNQVRNSKNGRRRRGSCSSSASLSPTPAARVADQAAKSATDDSVKIAPAISPSSSRRRFSMMCSRTQDDIDDSARSQGSGAGVGGIIGVIIHALDRSDNIDDLSVNFPSGRRRSSMMSDDYSTSSANPMQEQRGMSAVGHLFRSRKSELTVTSDDAVEKGSCDCEHGEEQDHGEEQEAVPQRRRPNRSKRMNGQFQASTRLISSTVAFPREDDDDCFGFD